VILVRGSGRKGSQIVRREGRKGGREPQQEGAGSVEGGSRCLETVNMGHTD
jgi:hypothetical protein